MEGVVSTENTHITCICCCQAITSTILHPCNHISLCLECSIRSIHLFQSSDCPICPVAPMITKLYAVRQPFKSYAEYEAEANEKRMLSANDQQMYYQDQELLGLADHYLDFHCPVCYQSNRDALAFASAKQLVDHVSKEHKQYLCKVCVDHRPVFSFEHRIYPSRNLLEKHQQVGDDPVDHLPEFAPHPSCPYCAEGPFYDQDALTRHFNQQHFSCHLCNQTHFSHEAHFEKYKHLEQHLFTEHFPCRHPSCQTSPEAIFHTKYDLQAHETQYHPRPKGKLRYKTKLQVDYVVQPAFHDHEVYKQKIRYHGVAITAMKQPELPQEDSFSMKKIKDELTNSTKEEMAERKSTLMKALKIALLNDEMKFDRFTRLTGEYYSGQLQARKYCEEFHRLFGKDADSLLNEFITIIPNPHIQQELFEAHTSKPRYPKVKSRSNKSKGKGKAKASKKHTPKPRKMSRDRREISSKAA